MPAEQEKEEVTFRKFTPKYFVEVTLQAIGVCGCWVDVRWTDKEDPEPDPDEYENRLGLWEEIGPFDPDVQLELERCLVDNCKLPPSLVTVVMTKARQAWELVKPLAG